MFIAIIQSTVASHIRLFGVSPNLVLLFTVSWALLRGMGDGILIGLAGGMVLDGLSGASFGLATISLIVVSGLAGFGEANVFRTAWFLPYVTIAIATFIHEGVFLLLLGMTGHAITGWPLFARVVLPTVVINVLCMPIVYRLAGWLHGRVYPPRAEWE